MRLLTESKATLSGDKPTCWVSVTLFVLPSIIDKLLLPLVRDIYFVVSRIVSNTKGLMPTDMGGDASVFVAPSITIQFLASSSRWPRKCNC